MPQEPRRADRPANPPGDFAVLPRTPDPAPISPAPAARLIQIAPTAHRVARGIEGGNRRRGVGGPAGFHSGRRVETIDPQG